jgi:hypothetical protein
MAKARREENDNDTTLVFGMCGDVLVTVWCRAVGQPFVPTGNLVSCHVIDIWHVWRNCTGRRYVLITRSTYVDSEVRRCQHTKLFLGGGK